jgi:hypothetical protein
LKAVGYSLWYQSNTGVLVYQPVTGDFKATTRVHVSKSSNTSMPPDQAIHLAGLMARSPSASNQSYVLGVIGFAEMGHLAVEYKETTNGNSVFGESPWPADAELRLCRVGSKFTVYHRTPETGTWNMTYQTTRTDLPATLQVGPNLYAASTDSDLIGSFDYFNFAPVGTGCTD